MSCYICLEECNIKRCSKCSLFAHDKCFREHNINFELSQKYKYNFSITEFQNYDKFYCPQCKEVIPQKLRNCMLLRSNTKKNRIKLFQNTAKHLLNIHPFLITEDERYINAVKMFELIKNNKKLLHSSDEFLDFLEITKNKIKELCLNNIEFKKYYYDIFDTPMYSLS